VNKYIGAGLWCGVPLVVYRDATGSLPRGASLGGGGMHRNWAPSGGDRTTRLADIILFWNAIEHFYPYVEEVGEEWIRQLSLSLAQAAVDVDGVAFEATLRRLVAQLHDGHGSVNSQYGDPRVMPICWRFIDGKLVILRTAEPYGNEIHAGDEVLAIGRKAVSEWVSEIAPLKSGGTAQALEVRIAEALHSVVRGDTATLSLVGESGVRRVVRVPRQVAALLRPVRPDSITELRPGTFYVDLERITDSDWQNVVPRLATAKGVILDLRGYPRHLTQILPGHWIDEPVPAYQWFVPIVTRPDHDSLSFDSLGWNLQPLKPRLKAPLAILMDASAISKAEAYLTLFDGYHLAHLVGEPTAGTNGNIVTVSLPGDFRVTFTCVKVRKCDGAPFNRVGILPTSPVLPTIAGIRAGRDEQLDRALEIVTSQP
jgi:C-terminal processing protease CtpA/Prc